MMKVSVIIPAFNRRPLIGIALQSLLRQRDAADLDIIVIDDGSTDGTADVVNEFIKREPCIRLIRQDNKGISGARNTGLRNIPADSDLVTFLDSDDVSSAGHFATITPLFRADPDLALTYSRMTLTNRIDDDSLLPAPGSLVCTVRGIYLGAAVFRRAAIHQVGLFDESLTQAEDFDFLIRFFQQSKKYLLLDNVAAIYRRHPENITKNRMEARRSLMHLALMNAQRRRRNPALADIPKFYEVEDLGDERYLSLR